MAYPDSDFDRLELYQKPDRKPAGERASRNTRMQNDPLPPLPSPDWRPAPPELELADGEIHLWRIFLDRPISAAVRDWLDATERARGARLSGDVARRRFESAHVAKRRLLADYLERHPADLGFTIGDQGKPTLAPSSGQTDPLEFNLSHSADLALLAVSRGRPLGVDLEKLKPINRALRIAERVFSATELARLKALPPAQRSDGFFRAWTRFEARQKLSGEGLFGPGGDRPEADSEGFVPAPGFVAALAWPRGPVSLRFFAFDDPGYRSEAER